MGQFIYDHNGQKVASGLRQFWIDPLTGETLVVTSSVREGDTLRSTLRRVRFVADANSAPAGADQSLQFEVNP